MRHTDHRCARPRSAARTHDTSLFVALELSRSTWLIGSSTPGSDRISKHQVPAADTTALLALLKRLKARAERYCDTTVSVISVHEAGLDGFWVHRFLEANGVESHVVDAASIAVNRRSRRAKTDRIDVEKLLDTLIEWTRGGRRVCSMVRPPSPAEEDERRLAREREALVIERTRHVNRIKGLLATQGVLDFEPIRKSHRKQLEQLRRWDGQALPPRLKAELTRELNRLELVISQVAAVEDERDRALKARQHPAPSIRPSEAALSAQRAATDHAGPLLLRLRSIGPEFASVLSSEAFYRNFGNRREVAGYAGLVPSPWKSGGIDVEQGISKAGNARLRKTMIQLAWLWLRHQPGSTLSRWFHERVGDRRGKIRRITIVAVARKLLIALWRYVTLGLVPEGAELKA
jgi:transposase